MQHSHSGETKILKQLLGQNSNPAGYKQVVGQVAKSIQQRTFWYFTTDEADFLNKVYDKKIDRQVLKSRIRQITTDKLDEVLVEIVEGKLKKKKEELDGELQVQLGIQDFYDKIPDQDERAEKGKERIKQINQDFKRFKDLVEEKKRYIENKKRQKQLLEQEFQKSLEKQKKQEQKAQIKKHLDSLKKNNEERQEQNQKFKAFLKQYKKSKPLHVLMEETYKQKVVLPLLQESRKKLQSLPHRKKPSLEQINEHDRQYLQLKSARPQKYVVLNATIDVSYKSQFYKHQEENLRQQKQFEETGPAWDFLEKQKRYSQFVKDKVKPKISPKIKEALQSNIKQNHHHYRQSPDRSKVIEVGKSYLQFMRSLEKRRTATPKQQPEKIKQSRYFNYLEELKTRSQHHSSSMDWEKDMKDRTSSRVQKRQRVLMKSKQLEEKAKRDEKLVYHYNYNKVDEIIAKKKEIDETLLSSIKAKVAVLKDAHQV